MAEPVYVERQPIPGTPYVYLKTLGVGGHGTVFSVEHVFLKHRAVMKVLHAEHGADEDLLRRSLDEGRILARMEHPNIVRAHDGGMTGEVPPRPYFVMDALQGLVLHAALRAAPNGLGFAMSTQIILGVLDGLDFAHAQHKVIHRDIKPANIFIHRTPTDTTVPKILDFGIAHFQQKRHRHTGRGFVGTPRYTAPEQIRGEKPTARTDLYAVGLVFYQCLTGQDPFADVRDYAALIHAHLNVVPRRLTEMMDGVPSDLDAIVACMLAKDPAARPESAAATTIALRLIKERLDRRFVAVLDKPEFRTEPTPLDNTLITTAASEGTQPPSEPRVETNDTVPGAPPFADVVAEATDRGAAEAPDAAGALHSTVPSPVQKRPAVDRHARTRASREAAHAAPRDGTARLADLAAAELARTDPAPAVTETPMVTASVIASPGARQAEARRPLFELGSKVLALVAAFALGGVIVFMARSSREAPKPRARQMSSAVADVPLSPSAALPSPEIAIRNAEAITTPDAPTRLPASASAALMPSHPSVPTPSQAATPRLAASGRRPTARPAAPAAPSAIGFD